MLPVVAGFDWDTANRDKCESHGVPTAAIERLFQNPLAVFPDPTHSGAEVRFRAIGRTGEGRYVFVAFTIRSARGQLLIRPISARYMHRKESDHYEEEITRAAQRRRS